MDTRFDPQSFEPKWQREWAARGWFTAPAEPGRESFCIMIPPPNVTGRLHMGHALQSTLQDVLTRWRRMQGRNALWLPGTDHAGIATQLMVERELTKEGTSRHDLGRERFVERVWQWKAKYHDNIRRQLEAMGSSCDFTRERFTLDEGLSRAVREAFVRLHGEGRIYRAEYLVNWSTGLDTAISDLEVEMRSVEDRLWHIAYPVEGSDERIVVSTTRPETLLGDTAIALNPADPRYQHLLGRRAVVPIAGRSIPFVADEAVEREFGTGLVKVTPFHDPADFEISRRHGLPGLSVIDRHGHMTSAAGAEFAGLGVDAARELLLERLRAGGFLVRDEPYVHNVGFCQRSGVRVQPLVSLQWFCDVSEMAAGALEAWRDGRLGFVPESWGKTWEHWLSGIRPWCISRQLWWGHQIPAWYDAAGNCYVARDLEAAERLAGTSELTQDGDVLDTWFSSALWPFSTLGWPDDTPDYRTFYPTSVLVTGFDILFFWVARMVMTGLHFTGQVPFARVHLTGLVRDAEGQKMSKTKGNVLDPEELIAEHGADAVRFTLATLDAPGRDIPLDASRMAGYRAFGNKIWNAARFVATKAPAGRVEPEIDPRQLELPERWILARLAETAGIVDDSLEAFRFDLACHHLYQFFWSDFCDWYIEMSKPGLEPATARPRVADVLVTVLERALRLLHPVMPHITEELWQRLPGREAVHPDTICLAAYPRKDEKLALQAEDERAFEELRFLVQAIRFRRKDKQLHDRAPVENLWIRARQPVDRDFVGLLTDQPMRALIERLGVVKSVAKTDEEVLDAISYRRDRFDLYFRFEEKEKRAENKGKIRADLEQIESALQRVVDRLASPGFTGKAPAAVIEGARKQRAELEAKRAALQSSLDGSFSLASSAPSSLKEE